MTAYGVKWVSNNSSSTLTRMGANVGLTGGATFNSIMPWKGVIRANLLDNGVVSAINDSTHGTTDLCYSDTEVSERGQVMVRIPAFYSYCDITMAADATTPRVVWWISNALGDVITNQDTTTYTITATDIHPAFVVDSVAKPYAYVSAYEGYYNPASGMLESKAGVNPTSCASVSVGNFRNYAFARNPTGLVGWNLYTIQASAMLKQLFITEYATLRSELALGWGYTATSPAIVQPTGATITNGNGSSSSSGTSTQPMVYRGVENLWGNMDNFTEGVNQGAPGNYSVWVAPQTNLQTTGNKYLCDWLDTPYVDTTVDVPAAGYISGVATATYPWAFIPNLNTGGQSWLYFGDYVTSSGAKVLFTGGNYQSTASAAGLFYLSGSASNNTYAYLGARLQYLP